MTDHAERLREVAGSFTGYTVETERAMYEAADHIEQLENLKGLVDMDRYERKLQ